MCGHLFCWPCLHQWLDTRPNRQLCPVCKSAISKERVFFLIFFSTWKRPLLFFFDYLPKSEPSAIEEKVFAAAILILTSFLFPLVIGFADLKMSGPKSSFRISNPGISQANPTPYALHNFKNKVCEYKVSDFKNS